MSRFLRILLFALCALAAAFAYEILSHFESVAERSADSEQTRLALRALSRDFAVPFSAVLALAGLAILLAPRALSWVLEKRFFNPPAAASNRRFLAALLLACFGLGLLLDAAAFRGFRITPDENTHLNQARIFAQGKLFGEAPPNPEFFEEPYLAHHEGRLFSIYQPGWSLMLAPAILLGVERAMPPLTAALSLLVIFLLARRLAGSGVARAAALILLFSPSFLFHSATCYSHMAEFLWISLFALAFVTARQEQRARGYLLAGVCLGAALLTRYFAVAFALPFALLLLWDLLSRKQGAWRNGVLFASPLVVAAGLALLYQWLLTGDLFLAAHEIYIGQARYLYVLSELEDPLRFFGFGSHYTAYSGLTRMLGRWWALNFWIFPLALVFLVPALVRPRKWDALFLLGFLCLCLAYVPYFLPGGWQYGPRYYFPAFGCLAFLIARGIGRTFGAVERAGANRRAFGGLACWLVFCLVWNVSVTVLMAAGLRLVARGMLDQERVLVVNGIRSGVVFVRTHPDFFGHAGPRDRPKEDRLRKDIPYYLIHNEADYGQPLLFAHSLGEEEDRSLMANFPGRRFYVFRANPFAAAFGIGHGELEEIRRGAGPEEPPASRSDREGPS